MRDIWCSAHPVPNISTNIKEYLQRFITNREPEDFRYKGQISIIQVRFPLFSSKFRCTVQISVIKVRFRYSVQNSVIRVRVPLFRSEFRKSGQISFTQVRFPLPRSDFHYPGQISVVLFVYFWRRTWSNIIIFNIWGSPEAYCWRSKETSEKKNLHQDV